MKKFLRISFLSFVAVSSVACAKRVPVSETFAGQGLNIGKVEVSLDTKVVEPERVQVFNALNGTETVKKKIIELLTQRNLYDPSSDIDMKVVVNDFRLRHGATRFFTGIFSGSDRIKGTVSLNRAGTEIHSSPLQASGGNGNPFNISRESRGTNLLYSAGSLAVAALQRNQMILTASPPVQQITAVVPVGEQAPMAQPVLEVVKKTKDCEVDQILSMKKMNLSDEQIRAACSSYN